MNRGSTGRELLILVPTWNEAGNVERVLRRITGSLPHADILVVDEDSRDGTPQIVERLRASLHRVSLVVRRGRRPGLGSAIRDGYRYALDNGYQAVCIVDCDLQQDPADVSRMGKAHPRADLVIGSRYLHRTAFARGYDRISRGMSVTGNAAVRLLFRFPYKDATTDFFLLDTRVLRSIPPESLVCQGYALFLELKVRAWRAGFRVAEAAVPTYERESGSSHRTWRQVYLFAKEVLAVWVSLFLSLHVGKSFEETNVCRRAVRD